MAEAMDTSRIKVEEFLMKLFTTTVNELLVSFRVLCKSTNQNGITVFWISDTKFNYKLCKIPEPFATDVEAGYLVRATVNLVTSTDNNVIIVVSKVHRVEENNATIELPDTKNLRAGFVKQLFETSKVKVGTGLNPAQLLAMHDICTSETLANKTLHEALGVSSTSFFPCIVIGRSRFHEENHVTVHVWNGTHAEVMTIWSDCLDTFRSFTAQNTEIVIFRAHPLIHIRKTTNKFAFGLCVRRDETWLESYEDATVAGSVSGNIELPTFEQIAACYACESFTSVLCDIDRIIEKKTVISVRVKRMKERQMGRRLGQQYNYTCNDYWVYDEQGKRLLFTTFGNRMTEWINTLDKESEMLIVDVMVKLKCQSQYECERDEYIM